MGNADDTHFIINLDNGQFLGSCGDEEVNYAVVTTIDEDVTMLVRVTGERSLILASSLTILKNESRNYPIQGVHDNVPGMVYRSGQMAG